MKKLFFLGAALAAALSGLGSHLFARVGETEAQLEARYGKPFSRRAGQPGFATVSYAPRDCRITVALAAGRSSGETWEKKDGAEFSGAEIAAFLREHAPGVEWKQPIAWRKSWTTADGAISATVIDASKLVVVREGPLDTPSARNIAEEKLARMKWAIESGALKKASDAAARYHATQGE